MEYSKVYNKIVARGKERGNDKKKLEGYYEAHHILPKCLGGADSKENLVLIDDEIKYMSNFVVGANEKDYHL